MSNPEIVRSSREMLLGFDLHTPNPCWSSYILERAFETVVIDHGGKIEDIMRALFELLGEFPSAFSEPTAYFIESAVKLSRVKYQANFESSNFAWLAHSIEHGCAPGQAYLAIWIVHPSVISARCAVTIVRELSKTKYWMDAINELSDELELAAARTLLDEWVKSGECPAECERDIRQRFPV